MSITVLATGFPTDFHDMDFLDELPQRNDMSDDYKSGFGRKANHNTNAKIQSKIRGFINRLFN